MEGALENFPNNSDFMKANRETKRLFVGGLSQAISKTDLQDQFTRFGEVSDVEIITRKDEQGNSQKIFAYVNIKIAETDLKKCMSVLNKTKWKGGTLQIQLAKESFLHRLAQEREEAKAKKAMPTTGSTTLLEKVGGVDFHMKAVPGTEVPGHKNWVVSKFGRILPILHLKSQHKHKIMKYDPSKYCHNLKKIEENFTDIVPITSLTWELEGSNDPMSKKRQGEFSDFHGPPKKIIKVQKDEGSMESKVSDKNSKTNQMLENNISTQHGSITPFKPLLASNSDTRPLHTSDFDIIWKRSSMSNHDDLDSEGELKMMIAEEENLQKTRCSSVNESESDPFEVVRDDFKSDIHRLHSPASLGISNVSCHVSNGNIGNDCKYDSSDTDEIIAMKKSIDKTKKSTECSQTEKPINNKRSFRKKDFSTDCIKLQKAKNSEELTLSHGVKSLNHKSPSDSSSSDSEKSEGEEEYKALMKNCPRLSLTLADLEKLASNHQEIPGKDESDGLQTPKHYKSDRVSKSPKTPHGLHSSRQCIHPEEIVASLLEEENTYSKQKPEGNNLKPKFQEFKGIGCLYARESVDKTVKENDIFNNITEHQSSLKPEDPDSISLENRSKCANGLSNKSTLLQPAKKVNSQGHIQPQKIKFTFESQNHMIMSSTSSEKGSKNPISCLLPLKGKKSLSLSVKSHKIDFDKDACHSLENRGTSKKERSDSSSLTSLEIPPEVSSRKAPQKSTTSILLSLSDVSDMNAKDKHAKDNQKRLAALAARQKAREVQKKLVHNALANLDGRPEDKTTHIIFASDSENEMEKTSIQEQSFPREELVEQESMGKASGKLFGSSDEEDSDSKDDSNRFNIKPQFEGRAGLKLMDLQLHFGSDERFRMDSRFLESDSEEEQEVNENKTTEEEELAAERKKTLNVVQSVLNINLNNPTSKGTVAAKKFKDIIHYDPTRDDHATYERKQDDKAKESKAK
ncbi:nucleolar protein 8 isoform X2 [Nannospalax galili]|uniref:nucleolar protein 8 isoform X2 n=1 Tax=Nannospalax galili TaxID=1026970 RepID=UPI00111BD5BC|nr:nucleolar protein 8 isoform X2 [Nannospalax galili]